MCSISEAGSAHRFCVSLISRLESDNEQGGGRARTFGCLEVRMMESKTARVAALEGYDAGQEVQTPNPTPHTLHPTPYTPHLTPQTPFPKPQTPNPTPHTPHCTPRIPHLKPHTPHPTPHIPRPTPASRTPTPKPHTPVSSSLLSLQVLEGP